jgi:uncharacterized membrane protein
MARGMDPSTAVEGHRRMRARWSTGRIEAFSDGVIAIAITLLVLEIGVETEDLAHPWEALADEWPSYLAYVTSFLTIGSVWLAHHGLFSRLRAVDAVLMRMNILLLMAVSFLPFPTRLMAEALRESTDAERAAVIVYGAVALAIEFLLVTMWRYAVSRPDLMPKEERPPPRPVVRRRSALSVAGYALAILVGFLLVPEIAAFAFLAVAARSIFAAEGDVRITFAPLGGDR